MPIVPTSNDPTPDEAANPDWFREPTPREHKIGAALFAGFGLFFVLLFLVEPGWSFRWVILTLGIISLYRALTHLLSIRAARRAPGTPEGKPR
jgi:hypothetical protein